MYAYIYVYIYEARIRHKPCRDLIHVMLTPVRAINTFAGHKHLFGLVTVCHTPSGLKVLVYAALSY